MALEQLLGPIPNVPRVQTLPSLSQKGIIAPDLTPKMHEQLPTTAPQ